VNGEGITLSEFQQALARSEQQFVAADANALQASVLDTLIEQALIEQAAAADNVVISDEALETEFQANRALATDQQAWERWLNENLYTEGDFRTSLRGMLIAGAMRDRLTQDISETMLHVHARHILVDTEQAALDVLTRLQNGEDFAALAANLSKDVTTRGQGGDLGWFVEGELLEPVLTQVSFSLNDGQIGGPVATRLGYHIIQKLGSEPRPLTPDRRAMLAQFRFESWVSGLTFNAVIERFLA
jgi:parvulin-like peptidyl-prolyl isomerase